MKRKIPEKYIPLRIKFRERYLPRLKKNNIKLERDPNTAKFILEHMRQWHHYAKQTSTQFRPQTVYYSLQDMLWANSRVKKMVARDSVTYYNSTVCPKPFEDYEIAALYVCMCVQGQRQGEVVPLTCANDQYLVVIDFSD